MRSSAFLILAGALTGTLAACTPANLQPQSQTGFGAGATGYGAPAAYPAQTAYGALPAEAPGTAVAPATGAIPSSEINSALFGTPAVPGTTAPGTYPAAGTFPAAGTVPAALPPATAPVPADTTAAAPAAGLSDEQDFNAVKSRETIESDKARIEANKARYQVIPPTALPERPGEAVSPVVAYVLNAPNGLGQPAYNRRSVKPEAHEAACQKYASELAAQEAFLKAGGPDRDPKKLDPDGDGYACRFDPTPYRQGGN